MTQPPPRPLTLPAPFISSPADGTTGLPVNGLQVSGNEDLATGSTFNVYLIDPSGVAISPGAGSNLPAPNGTSQRWTALFYGLQASTWYTCIAVGRTPGNSTYSDARSYQTA